jgi:hypothetical protein
MARRGTCRLGSARSSRVKDARELHLAAKKLLGTGISPMAERKAEAEAKHEEAKALQREAESSFENVAVNGGSGGLLVSRHVMRIPPYAAWKLTYSPRLVTRSLTR